MIVKIWPIKADYANDKSKVGGQEGLKNAVDYITDPEKVIVSRDNVHQMEVMDEDSLALGPEDFDIGNRSRVLHYMSNEDKIEGKYISGYLCDPENAVAEFNSARERTLDALHRTDKKETGAVAFHIVQSFPEGLNISDEEVHRCGLELCEKLNAYQGVVCSHVHSVKDEDGSEHGKSKHNHILINAYRHPDKLDPERPEIAKYNDCNETYAQLRAWNDEIAIDHGLPIIRNPDDDRLYSWKETDAINKGLSWKQRVRVDIQAAKRSVGSWEEFVQQMESAGYKIRDGKHISFTTPDEKHVVRGNTLGRQYTKPNMETYWKVHDYALHAVEQEMQNNTSSPLLDFVLASQGVLSAAVPLGMKSQEQKSFRYLPMESVTQTKETLQTYFNEDEHYDICDEHNRSVMSATGKEIIECMELLRNGKQKASERQEAPEQKSVDFVFDFTKRREKEQYYTYIYFVNSKTKRPYRTSLYDNNGRRRSVLELMLLLAIIVLKKEEGLWEASSVPVGKENDPIYAPRNWKIQNMIDSIYTAKEEEIETPAQLDQRLKDAGAAYSRARTAHKNAVRTKQKMETLNTAVMSYRQTEALAKQILDMPEGEEKNQLQEEYKDILDRYRSAKAVLYRYKVTNEDQIVDFEQRYQKIQSDILELDERLELAKEDYRKLKKLSYNVQLAESQQYCYGPEYTYENVYQQEQERESDEARNKRAERNVDDLIQDGTTKVEDFQKEEYDSKTQHK